ncbi:hypothetical protein AAFX91_07935 [Bradyrhizobium sp. 31Argb]|nr:MULTISPECIES: hypothetical protein [unclassified Bradyrhizobium]MDI4237985.1 hypothetical protein [Bradyrhizobium sp. Arg237L]
MGSLFQPIVIAGLDPAIHRAKRILDFLMDARVKPAHDDLRMGRPS